jgi:hypothetical protein
MKIKLKIKNGIWFETVVIDTDKSEETFYTDNSRQVYIEETIE